MNTYHFDILSEAVATREILDAADDAAAIRQAVLLVSEILRDHALSSQGDVTLTLVVRDAAGRKIWSGGASGQV
ncbi:DUF6894 family protein [Caulobacter segnis]